MMSEVLSGLWVGSWKDGDRERKNPKMIVIGVADDPTPPAPARHFPISDPGTKPTDPEQFALALEHLRSFAGHVDHHVLVHCQSGVNRSPSIIIAYLMKFGGLPLADAHNAVKRVRPLINPCDGQLKLAVHVVQGVPLDSVTVDRSGFLEQTFSPNQKIVNDLYLEILGRKADPDGLAHYSGVLDSGKSSPDYVRHQLTFSEEAKNLSDKAKRRAARAQEKAAR